MQEWAALRRRYERVTAPEARAGWERSYEAALHSGMGGRLSKVQLLCGSTLPMLPVLYHSPLQPPHPHGRRCDVAWGLGVIGQPQSDHAAWHSEQRRCACCSCTLAHCWPVASAAAVCHAAWGTGGAGRKPQPTGAVT